MTFRELKIGVSEDRPIIKELIDYKQFCSPKNIEKSQSEVINKISVWELHKLLKDDKNEIKFSCNYHDLGEIYYFYSLIYMRNYF